MKLLLHPDTELALDDFARQPSHALIIIGPIGAGKDSLAYALSARLLEIDHSKLANNAHFLQLVPAADEPLGIEIVGQLAHFMALKTPGPPNKIRRIVYVPRAETMTIEAQNSLLKLLEEPPLGSLFILGSSSEQALLPTIRSRSQKILARKPATAELRRAMIEQGHQESKVDQALKIAAGWPGLATALLDESAEHPLSQAALVARRLLAHSTLERLAEVDTLHKQRVQSEQLCYVLQQMAQLGLQSAKPAVARRWQQILRAAYDCERALQARANVKLALTELMLSL